MPDDFDQEDPFKKYGGKAITDTVEDPFKKYGGTAIAEPPKKKSLAEAGLGIGGLGGVGTAKGGLSTVKKTPIEGVETYNKNFREATGLQEEFSLGSDLPQIKKEREQKKYEEFRGIEENEINPVLASIATGTADAEQLKTLYNKPYGRKIVREAIGNVLPETNAIGGLDEEVFGSDKKWEPIAAAIQEKNRAQGVEAQNQSEYELDNELATTLPTYTYGRDRIGVRGGGEAFSQREQQSIGELNTTNPQELQAAKEKILSGTKLWDKDGNEVAKDDVVKKIDARTFQLKAMENLHPEVFEAKDKVLAAVSKVPVQWKKDLGDNAELAAKDGQYVLSGLNYIRDLQPGKYAMIMGTIDNTGKMAETDYQELVTLGKEVNKFKDFKEGRQIVSDNRSFLTPQVKQAHLAGELSNILRGMNGTKNRFKVKDADIRKAYEQVSPELKDDELLNNIRKMEAVGAGGKGITKTGGIYNFFRGVVRPLKGIGNTIDFSIASPYEAYLESKKLDRGDQLIPDGKGGYTDRLKEGWLNKATEGFGSFLTQVMLTRGIGGITAGGANAIIGRVAPRAANITTSGAALNVGTPLSVIAQSYGDEYVDFLGKTGNPTKAGLGAFTSVLAQSVIERFVMPDVKIADKIAQLKMGGRDFGKQIISVIENGGGKAAIGKAATDFVGNITKTLGKEAWAEETAQNAINFLTESIISPNTSKDRDLLDESIDVGLNATTDMAFASLLGGAGDSKVKRQLTKAQLHHIGANASLYQNALDRELTRGWMNKEQHELASAIIAKHGENVANAPKRDEKGELISAERQLEYAYQSTVVDINKQKAADPKLDNIQKEPFEKKIEEADKIKRQIFYGEENKNLPPKESEPIVIDQERELNTEGAVDPEGAIQNAIENGTLKGMYLELALQGKGDEVLKDIAQQAQNLNEDGTPKNDGREEASMQATREQFGDLVDIAVKAHPKDPSPEVRGEVVPIQENLGGSGKVVTLGESGKEAQNITSKEAESTENSTQPSIEESPEQLSKRYKRVTDENDFVDPYDVAVKYFADGGRINPAELERIFGGKGDKGARISLMKNNAGTVKQIAHRLWEADQTGKYEDTHYIDAVESALRDFPSKSAMQKDLADRYDLQGGYEKYLTQSQGKEAIDIVERMTEEEMNAILQMESDQTTAEKVGEYLDSLIQQKNETSISSTEAKDKQSNISTEKESQPDTEPNQDSEGAGTIPPIPPPEEPSTTKGEEKNKLNDKGVLSHLHKAKNIPEAARKGFEAEGLKYETKSQEEAQAVAKSVIEEMGIEDAVLAAEAMKFDGDVNSLIFAQSLNQLAEQEQKATTDEEKAEIAKKFAEVGITYDKMARVGGRFNAAINYFYKKSPLGIVMMENAKRQDEFNTWANQGKKPKDKSWEDFFADLRKEPEFEELIQGLIKKGSKEERAKKRDARKKKVDEFFNKAKDQFKGGAAYSIIIPPPIIRAAIEGMHKAYQAGEIVFEVIEEAVAYISQHIGDGWDKDKFKKEWEEKFSQLENSKELLDEEKKRRILDKFGKKLLGLTEDQKAELLGKAYKKILDAGALDYEGFRRMIADVTGRGDLSSDQVKQLKKLIHDTNVVDDFGKRLREQKTNKSFQDYKKAQMRAALAARDLADMFDRKDDILRLLVAAMQGSTISITNAALLNPAFNIVNQLSVRLPNSFFQSLVDLGGRLFLGKKYKREYSTLEAQGSFFKELGKGAVEAVKQIGTGLNRQDYNAKEIYPNQIRPIKALKSLKNDRLTSKQKWHRRLQVFPGTPAELIFRVLNLGDKPMRFAAEGAQASAFAKSLGIKPHTMDFKIFMEFPREEAYRIYKEKGLSDDKAGEQADYIKESIIQEGKRSTFQQDNIVTDGLNKLFGESGKGQLAKATLVSPYVKIPSNAFWSFFNIAHPTIALAQAAGHLNKARQFKAKGENVKAMRQQREARYWFGHAAVGIGWNAVAIPLIKAGIIAASASPDDESKKERQGEATYEPQGTLNLTKLFALLRGENPDDVKESLTVNLKWFGSLGMFLNSVARDYEEMDEEQRENRDLLMGNLLEMWDTDDLRELQNGVFSNSSSMFNALGEGGYSANRYFISQINMMANLVHPATAAQLERAAMPYYTKGKADSFLKELDNSLLQRSLLYRLLSKKYPPSIINLWGEPMKKDGNFWNRVLGFNRVSKDNFAQVLYDDAKKENSTDYFPPAVTDKIGETKLNPDQLTDREIFVGQARKNLIGSFSNDLMKFPIVNKVYSELNPEQKKKAIECFSALGREQGDDQLFIKYPELKPKEKTISDQVSDELFQAALELMGYKNKK